MIPAYTTLSERANMKNTASLLSLTVSALLLTACGGGGGGQPDISATPTSTKGWSMYKHYQDDEWEYTYTASKDDIGDIPGEEYRINNIVMTFNNKKYHIGNKVIDISNLPLGLNNLKYQIQVTQTRLSNQTKDDQSAIGSMRLYKQQYSVIAGNNLDKLYSMKQGELTLKDNEYSVDDAQGRFTPFEQLPKAGKFTYNGSAFTANEEGKLTYTVDFDKSEGSGSISGLNRFGDISLHKGELKKITTGPLKNGGEIWGQASSANHHKGYYDVTFFGPNSEEIAGNLRFDHMKVRADGKQDSLEIGIAGSREPLK
ncbi:hypothetical protein BWD10_02835 [Neisseria zoodegmatis]|uniref:Factor H binding protein-like C-terminal domain-containing protein n=2 Tax=Neisseria zoodegmatis TaxID=326523 RepID=A0ABX3WFK4_9NEIS|nr:hypothetical protein BWD10_02835 [Neisseria zoodegmatis]